MSRNPDLTLFIHTLYVCGFQKVQLQACGQSRLRDLGMRTDVRAGEGKIAVTLKRRFCDE